MTSDASHNPTLSQLHTAIEKFFRDAGGIPADDADVRFARPAARWLDQIERATLNCFLFAMSENHEFRNALPRVQREGSGAVTRLAPRRVDLHYLVCGFDSQESVEYLLTWRALVVLLRHATLPPECWPKGSAPEVAVPIRVGGYEGAPQQVELWQALGVPPRPALICTLTAPVDLLVETASPLVLTRATRFTEVRRPAPPPAPPDPRFRWPVDAIEPEPVTPTDERRGDWTRWRVPTDRVVIDTPHGGEQQGDDGLRFEIGGVVRDRHGVVAGAQVGVVGRAIVAETDKQGVYKMANLKVGDQLQARRAEPDAWQPQPLTVPAERYDISLK